MFGFMTSSSSSNARKLRREDRQKIKKVLRGKKEEMDNLRIYKSVLGDIEIEYEIYGIEVYLRVEKKQKVAFSTFNYNFYQDLMTPEENEKLSLLARTLIESDKNRLRLLF